MTGILGRISMTLTSRKSMSSMPGRTDVTNRTSRMGMTSMLVRMDMTNRMSVTSTGRKSG